jgi:hypothetical protein
MPMGFVLYSHFREHTNGGDFAQHIPEVNVKASTPRINQIIFKARIVVLTRRRPGDG